MKYNIVLFKTDESPAKTISGEVSGEFEVDDRLKFDTEISLMIQRQNDDFLMVIGEDKGTQRGLARLKPLESLLEYQERVDKFLNDFRKINRISNTIFSS